MNKYIICLILGLIVLGFSGITSATTITDKGGQTTYSGMHGDFRDVYSWYVVKYSDNHIVWIFKDTFQLKNHGVWNSIRHMTIKTYLNKYSSGGKIYGTEYVYSDVNYGYQSIGSHGLKKIIHTDRLCSVLWPQLQNCIHLLP